MATTQSNLTIDAETRSLNSLVPVGGLKSYQLEKRDEETGEVAVVSKYKYLEGHPKQYRFNGQTGRFNLNGETDLGNKMTIQPVAWRIFEENLFERGRKEQWAEIFFVDDKNCISVVMFNNTSVNVLFGLIEPLFYEELSLSDVMLTISAEKKENTKITPKGTYYIAKFSYVPADATKVKEVRDFVRDHRIYRADTLTPTAEYKAVSKGFYNALAYMDSPLIGGESIAA